MVSALYCAKCEVVTGGWVRVLGCDVQGGGEAVLWKHRRCGHITAVLLSGTMAAV